MMGMKESISLTGVCNRFALSLIWLRGGKATACTLLDPDAQLVSSKRRGVLSSLVFRFISYIFYNARKKNINNVESFELILHLVTLGRTSLI